MLDGDAIYNSTLFVEDINLVDDGLHERLIFVQVVTYNISQVLTKFLPQTTV
jgi:hypothetical protein